MKKISYTLFSLLMILFVCCTESNEISAEDCQELLGDTKIMPLGASRVQGARPLFESYRYELWKDLVEGNWSVDFVGTQTDIGIYDQSMKYCFDTDHEGRSGWTSTQINANIERWLQETETPDIVLFSSPGGNDALQGATIEEILPNINAIIDKIQAHNPNVIILIEQTAPPKAIVLTADLKAALEEMNTIIPELAAEQSTGNSKVIPVDMATGFSDDFLADNLHYNFEGAAFIASRYYNKLVPLLEK